MTGKLQKSLKYQDEGKLMMMESNVLCLKWSRDSEMIATGSKDGKIRVCWAVLCRMG